MIKIEFFILGNDSMNVLDIRNKKIKVGSKVKYLGTNTHGTVEEICLKNNVYWVMIDSTNLYYLPNHLEVINYKKKDKSSFYSNNLKQNLLRIKSIKKSMDTQISDHGDGPGYGGG
ncbi:MAG: DUF2098 family protein [Methanobacteriaceae archaeon]|nr:DUF2098 family protein [Methanobacteriaceae archaeon]